MDSARSWGDGATRNKAHVIEFMSYAEGWVECYCGERAERTAHLTLEDAWDVHRGRADLVTARALDPEYADLASDDEVAAFLDNARNPRYAYDPRDGGDE